MHNFDSLIFPMIFGGLAGLVLGVLFSGSVLAEITRIRRTPTDPISALPVGGQVEVSGKTVSGPEELHSPISGSTCVLWKVEVLEQRGSGRSSHWASIYKGSSTQSFGVNDGTGEVNVSPVGADLILYDDLDESSSIWTPLEPKVKAALEKLGITTQGSLGFERSLRIHERFMQADEEIYVLGEIRQVDGSKSLSGTQETPLVISDRSEQELLTTLYWKVISTALAATALGAFVVYILFQDLIKR